MSALHDLVKVQNRLSNLRSHYTNARDAGARLPREAIAEAERIWRWMQEGAE